MASHREMLRASQRDTTNFWKRVIASEYAWLDGFEKEMKRHDEEIRKLFIKAKLVLPKRGERR